MKGTKNEGKRGRQAREAYRLKEEMIRVTWAVAWSAGRLPGGIGDFGVFMYNHLASSFRCYLIRTRAGVLFIDFDTPIPF